MTEVPSRTLTDRYNSFTDHEGQALAFPSPRPALRVAGLALSEPVRDRRPAVADPVLWITRLSGRGEGHRPPSSVAAARASATSSNSCPVPASVARLPVTCW